jgi:hypothetical protein
MRGVNMIKVHGVHVWKYHKETSFLWFLYANKSILFPREIRGVSSQVITTQLFNRWNEETWKNENLGRDNASVSYKFGYTRRDLLKLS